MIRNCTQNIAVQRRRRSNADSRREGAFMRQSSINRGDRTDFLRLYLEAKWAKLLETVIHK